MSRKIGINVVSLAPWSLGVFGLYRAMKMAQEAGFDGLQLLPLRGWNDFSFLEIPKDKIISYQLAWNCGALFFAILRRLHFAGEKYPLFHDWALFGTRKAAKRRARLISKCFPDALFISRDLHESSTHRGVLEMNPETGKNISVYKMCSHGLVWDIEHILRRGRHKESPVTTRKGWRSLLEELRFGIRIVHVKSSADTEMLEALGKATDCPVILEDKPPFSRKALVFLRLGIIFENWPLIGKVIRPKINRAEEKMMDWLKDRRAFLDNFFGKKS